MKKVILLLVLIIVISGETITAGDEHEPPLHYVDSTSTVVGIDADILRSSLKRVEREIQFRKIPWTRTLLEVEEGMLGIAIGAKFTKERNEFAWYSVPYKSIQHWLFTRSTEYQDITSLKELLDMDSVKLGVVRGWGYPDAISRLIRDEKYADKINPVNSFAQLPKMLQFGRVDGIIASPEMLLQFELNKALFSERAKYREELHFLLSRQLFDENFVTDFNRALQNLLDEGELQRLWEKYIPE